MAIITTDEQFARACNQLVSEGALITIGARFIDRVTRRVIDENDNSDITPSMAVLESALDRFNTALVSEQQEQSDDTTAKDNLLAIVDTGLTQIADDIAAIDGGGTAQLAQILRRTLVRQDRMIKAMRAVIRNR